MTINLFMEQVINPDLKINFASLSHMLQYQEMHSAGHLKSLKNPLWQRNTVDKQIIFS